MVGLAVLSVVYEIFHIEGTLYSTAVHYHGVEDQTSLASVRLSPWRLPTSSVSSHSLEPTMTAMIFSSLHSARPPSESLKFPYSLVKIFPLMVIWSPGLP